MLEWFSTFDWFALIIVAVLWLLCPFLPVDQNFIIKLSNYISTLVDHSKYPKRLVFTLGFILGPVFGPPLWYKITSYTNTTLITDQSILSQAPRDNAPWVLRYTGERRDCISPLHIYVEYQSSANGSTEWSRIERVPIKTIENCDSNTINIVLLHRRDESAKYGHMIQDIRWGDTDTDSRGGEYGFSLEGQAYRGRVVISGPYFREQRYYFTILNVPQNQNGDPNIRNNARPLIIQQADWDFATAWENK